ncbi:MAG: zf-HC2 domain-containing protein [Caldilineales bacterium]|nr:zf-HC2 domain-containing protein [Caldilineales bacterium]
MNHRHLPHEPGHCGQMLTLLNDYVDGALAPELCTALETHLAACQNCQIVLDTLRKTVYLVQQLPEAPVALPEEVEQRLFAALALADFL